MDTLVGFIACFPKILELYDRKPIVTIVRLYVFSSVFKYGIDHNDHNDKNNK